MDQGQLTRYRQALLAGNNIQAPTASPNATPALAGVMGNLQNLAKSSLQGGYAKLAQGAAGGAAGAQANQEEASAKLALQEQQDQLDAAQQQKKDLLDPSKYKQEIDENGGYKFFDPAGQEINVKQYSSATGKHITDVLKKSQNPSDQQFTRDYGMIEKLGGIMQSGDKKALDKLYKEQPDLKKQIDGKTYSQIVTDFRKYYPKFFNSSPSSSVDTTYANKTPKSISGGGGNLFTRALSSLFGG